MTGRPYRALPALAAFVLFLAAGSAMVRWIMGGEATLTPLQEMQCVHYALALPAHPPETLSAGALGELLDRLDPQLRPIADRVTILDYSADDDGFQLQAGHAGDPGRTYRIDLRGVH